MRKNTGGTGESDVSSLPSLSSLYLPRFHFSRATFHYLKVWNRLHKRLFDSNGLVHLCLLSYFLPSFLPTYPLIYLTTHPATYTNFCERCLTLYLPTHPSNYSLNYPSTHPPICLHSYIPTYLPTYLPMYLSTYITTYPPTYIPNCYLHSN